MTDTATGAPAPTVKRSQKPRNVDYSLEIVDDLPEDDVKRHSPLEDSLAKIVANDQYHGKFVRIGAYENGSAASAAANVLRQRHGGDTTVEGFTIRPKRFTEKGADGQPDKELTGLFVKYDPSTIVEGARAEWDRKEAERKAKIAAKRVAEGKSPESTLPGNRVKADAGTSAQQASDANGGKAATPPPPVKPEPAAKK